VDTGSKHQGPDPQEDQGQFKPKPSLADTGSKQKGPDPQENTDQFVTGPSLADTGSKRQGPDPVSPLALYFLYKNYFVKCTF
jgi:hypothetical protein